MADDLGYGDSRAWYPASDKDTPTLNALADQGVKFTRFYTDSTCSTSRAALLTGMHPARLGFQPVARGISSELVTLPEYLQEQGYRTGLIGKWHVGEWYAQAQPGQQGFQQFYGYLNQWLLQGPVDGVPTLRTPVYDDAWLENERGEGERTTGYLPDVLTARARAWIAEFAKSKQPWFLMYATPLPHAPLAPPPELRQQNPVADSAEIYRAMVVHFDRNLAELMAELDATDQLKNTLVIVLSDNGAPLSRHGSNAGFVGGKNQYAEGAVRTPLLWLEPQDQKVWLGSQVKKMQVDEPVFITDIFPTLQRRIGGEVRIASDGIDLFERLPARALHWLSSTGFSTLLADTRFNGSWLQQQWTDRQRETIQGVHSQQQPLNPEDADYQRAEAAYKTWLDKVAEVALTERDAQWWGSDFLRTPLGVWDFYIAFTRTSPTVTGQPEFIAGQPGVWQLSLEEETFVLQLHGQTLRAALPAPLKNQQCYLLGVNADLFDRYSTLRAEPVLSNISLNLDDTLLLFEQRQFDDLTNVDVTLPLQVAQPLPSGLHGWRGQLSAPRIFHRGNWVGGWAFKLDERQLRQALCADRRF